MSNHQSNTSNKLPREIHKDIFAFPPNRDTMGATAYLIVEETGNILVDSPAWNETNQQFLTAQGGVSWLFMTHRGGIGKAREIHQALGCRLLIQEQEAYLLPNLEVTTFQHRFQINEQCLTIWTPGHSPGSSCLYCDRHGGILFSGRHLLPDHDGKPRPLRVAKTFHWPRQIRSVQHLLDAFNPGTLQTICPGANTGFLRGRRVIETAYQQLSELNLDEYMRRKPGL
ncbi:MAG: MBL fold metallo-hydrolase [Elainellaceae cyanobacterium]